MCAIEAKTYRQCRANPQHNVRGAYLRCAAAQARQGRGENVLRRFVPRVLG